MELGNYQREAQRTDQFAGERSERLVDPRMIPLLGMGGEVGSLLAEYKKWVRDGDAHKLFPTQMEEELGDILWYLANAATRFGLDLDQIAHTNLSKTRDRWPPEGTGPAYHLYDEEFGAVEQLPRRFIAELCETHPANGECRVIVTIDGKPAGDSLADNAHDPDGYRFHDVFHLAHAAKLGWSPVLRGKLLKRPRRSHRTGSGDPPRSTTRLRTAAEPLSSTKRSSPTSGSTPDATTSSTGSTRSTTPSSRPSST